MKTDQAAAAFDVLIENGLLAVAQISRVALIDHNHIGVFEVGAARRMQGAIDYGPVRGQKLAPVGEELRVIVLALAMGLEAAPKVYVHTIAVLSLRQRSAAASRLCPGTSGQEDHAGSAKQKFQDPRPRRNGWFSSGHKSPPRLLWMRITITKKLPGETCRPGALRFSH